MSKTQETPGTEKEKDYQNPPYSLTRSSCLQPFPRHFIRRQSRQGLHDLMRKPHDADGIQKLDLVPLQGPWVRHTGTRNMRLNAKQQLLNFCPELVASASPEGIIGARQVAREYAKDLATNYPEKFTYQGGEFRDTVTGQHHNLRRFDDDAHIQAAKLVEHDFMLAHKPQGAKEYRLVAGVTCFPLNFNVYGYLGAALSDIHSEIPVLNEHVGKQINGYMDQMVSRRIMERINITITNLWKLCLLPELITEQDMEPAIHPLDPGYAESQCVRIEHETFKRLEGERYSRYILFSFLTYIYPLSTLKPNEAKKLHDLLKFQPKAFKRNYKNMNPAEERAILQFLQQKATDGNLR